MRPHEAKLTQEKLRHALSYDPKTGSWVWINPGRPCRTKTGHEAGSINTKGYRVIYIDGERYMAHRLAWFWMTGEWPRFQLDHKNLRKDDNRWDNLREATGSQNMANRIVRSDSKTGLKGVSWSPQIQKWNARIRRRWLGSYDCPAAAHFAYLISADQDFGRFARGG